MLQKRVVSRINSIPYESIHLDFDNLVHTCHSSDKPLLDKSPDSLDTVSTIKTPREGLYCRTKRILGLKRDPINYHPFQIFLPTPISKENLPKGVFQRGALEMIFCSARSI